MLQTAFRIYLLNSTLMVAAHTHTLPTFLLLLVSFPVLAVNSSHQLQCVFAGSLAHPFGTLLPLGTHLFPLAFVGFSSSLIVTQCNQLPPCSGGNSSNINSSSNSRLIRFTFWFHLDRKQQRRQRRQLPTTELQLYRVAAAAALMTAPPFLDLLWFDALCGNRILLFFLTGA